MEEVTSGKFQTSLRPTQTRHTRKPMYKRVEAPMDGFLKIVPNTGCHFFNYKFYSGVEYGIDYRFGQQNRLSNYEDEVSGALNRILRHQVGKASENQSLVCDDAGWVPIDDVLQCEGIWRRERLRWPHTLPCSLWERKDQGKLGRTGSNV